MVGGMGPKDDEGLAMKRLCGARRSPRQGMAGPHGEDPRPRGDAIDRELPFLRVLEFGSVADIQVSRQDSFNLGQRGQLGELEVDLWMGELERTDVRGELSGEGGGGHE